MAIVCIGQSRTMKLRHTDPVKTVDIHLSHGSVLVMKESCIRDWKHGIPKRAKSVAPGPLTCITLRVSK
jgi:alkylated DNA repair dioxygenase AlkB